MAEKTSLPSVARIYQLCSTEQGRRAFIQFLGTKKSWDKSLEEMSENERLEVRLGIESRLYG